MMPLSHIVIIGGGPAAWMTAACLISTLPRRDGKLMTAVSVLVAGTADTGTLSGGPAFRAFNHQLGIPEAQLASACAALPVLGSRYAGFGPAPFYRVFGDHGTRLNTVAFHHALSFIDKGAYDDFALSAQLADHGRFAPPSEDRASVRSTYDYGLSLDGALYAAGLRQRALSGGAQEIRGAWTDIECDTQGHIRHLGLSSGQRLVGDLFIDTQGGLLPKLGVAFVPAGLTTDSMAEISAPGEAATAHRLTALDQGYEVRRSLASGDRCLRVWASGDGDALSEDIAVERFRQGRLSRFWQGNALAIGQAAGRLEPLLGDGTDFAVSGVDCLMSLFPDAAGHEVLAGEYNRLMTARFDHTADMVHLFRSLWQGGEAPPPAQRKIEQFRSRGRVVMYDDEAFSEGEIVSILLGLGVVPERYERRLDTLDPAALRGKLMQMRDIVARTAAAAPQLRRTAN